jgi:predicted nucleic acid-binding protein
MAALNLDGLDGALVLVDAAPIVYVVERHPVLAQRFTPLFEAEFAGRLQLAVTTVALAEAMAGAFSRDDEAGAQRLRAVLESWRIVDLDSDIAEAAARWRASSRLELPDAIQVASALAIGAAALATHDRDFRRIKGLRIIS